LRRSQRHINTITYKLTATLGLTVVRRSLRWRSFRSNWSSFVTTFWQWVLTAQTARPRITQEVQVINGHSLDHYSLQLPSSPLSVRATYCYDCFHSFVCSFSWHSCWHSSVCKI